MPLTAVRTLLLAVVIAVGALASPALAARHSGVSQSGGVCPADLEPESIALAAEWHAIAFHGVHAGGDLVFGDDRVSAAELVRLPVAVRRGLADRWVDAVGRAGELAAYREAVSGCSVKTPLRPASGCEGDLITRWEAQLGAARLAPDARCR